MVIFWTSTHFVVSSPCLSLFSLFSFPYRSAKYKRFLKCYLWRHVSSLSCMLFPHYLLSLGKLRGSIDLIRPSIQTETNRQCSLVGLTNSYQKQNILLDLSKFSYFLYSFVSFSLYIYTIDYTQNFIWVTCGKLHPHPKRVVTCVTLKEV